MRSAEGKFSPRKSFNLTALLAASAIEKASGILSPLWAVTEKASHLQPFSLPKHMKLLNTMIVISKSCSAVYICFNIYSYSLKRTRLAMGVGLDPKQLQILFWLIFANHLRHIVSPIHKICAATTCWPYSINDKRLIWRDRKGYFMVLNSLPIQNPNTRLCKLNHTNKCNIVPERHLDSKPLP